ncbi:hypothetical protein B0T14DRAFT_39695 [Immersiella caudata]|uniref:Uncharacterized protein n=1 Tax=Immersiella caudata TaxID=314043 RepID=A0AA40CBT9_9PEZI|nr:hypothetical protein B0T14DRAFT_39695 [Immersiella caudata]
MATLILWIALPTSWELGNVRAILALIINFLCVVGVWVVAYSTWKVGALKLSRPHKPSTKLLSLYFPTGLGDVVDVIPLLRPSMGLGLLTQLIIPGGIIAILSAVAVVSAPIARYSTRIGEQIQQTLVPGTLASTDHSGIGGALVKWNATIDRLNSAGFPTDQLIDFLPDNRIDWKFSETEWNNSWSASCKWTERTPIELYMTGNTSNTGHLFDELQGLRPIFPEEILQDGYTEWYNDVGPYWGDKLPDVLLFVAIQTHPDKAWNETTQEGSNHLPFHFTIAAVHMHNAPANRSSVSGVGWGTGPIEHSSYTMANCEIQRVASRTPDELDEYAEHHIANPWTWDFETTVFAYKTFYEATLTEQSFRKEPIYHPSGQDLFRFYQAYLVSKDIQNYEDAEKVISVVVPTVELSIPLLVVFLLYLGLMGLTALWFVVLKRLPPGASAPRTKIEWMAQGMRESSAREVDATFLGAGWGKIKGELREAEVVTSRDPAQGFYNTIQLGSQVRQQRSLGYSIKG